MDARRVVPHQCPWAALFNVPLFLIEIVEYEYSFYISAK